MVNAENQSSAKASFQRSHSVPLDNNSGDPTPTIALYDKHGYYTTITMIKDNKNEL